MLASEICAELVHDFLIPETARMKQREEENFIKSVTKEAVKQTLEETTSQVEKE